MNLSNQLVRYGVIGVTTNAVSYLLYLCLTMVGYLPTTVISWLYPLTVVVSFYANKRLTFNFKGPALRTLIRFAFAHVLGYLLNLGILLTFVNLLEFPHQLIQLAAIFFVAVFLFILSRQFVFVD